MAGRVSWSWLIEYRAWCRSKQAWPSLLEYHGEISWLSERRSTALDAEYHARIDRFLRRREARDFTNRVNILLNCLEFFDRCAIPMLLEVLPYFYGASTLRALVALISLMTSPSLT